MRKIFFVPVLLLVLAIQANTQTAKKKPIQTLIIDPGHGGMDPGAVGMITSEANISLQVSLKLGDMIAKAYPDIKIVYTRTSDVLPGNKKSVEEALQYRANLANESGGDLFIAIHCNSAGKKPGGWYERRIVNTIPVTKTYKKGKKTYKKTVYQHEYDNVWVENKPKGTETYLWAVSKNESKVSSVIKNEEYGEVDSTTNLKMPDPTDPVEKVRMLIYAQNYFRKSLTLADYIQEEFKDAGRVNRGVKQRNDKGIWVLQATGMPSILVEIGFISNKEEEEYLISEAGQNEVVKNIFDAFKKYKEKQEDKAKDKDEDEKKGF